MLVGKIRFKYAGIVLILDWKSQHLEVLVIRDRRIINLKQKRRDSWKRRWRLVGDRGERRGKFKCFSISNSLCFMSPSSLYNPSKCNFVTTYRIRQQDKKYASCIQIYIFDVGKNDWDNRKTAFSFTCILFFTLLSYNKAVKHNKKNNVNYHFTKEDILHFYIKVAWYEGSRVHLYLELNKSPVTGMCNFHFYKCNHPANTLQYVKETEKLWYS